MKLTKADKEFLKRNFWEKDDAIDHIERALDYTDYEIQVNGGGWKKSNAKEVIELIGRERWLSGLDRCAFHMAACNNNEDNTVLAFFDATRFFRRGK